MKILNALYRLYYKVPDFTKAGILGKVIDKVFAKLLKKVFDNYFPKHYQNSQISLVKSPNKNSPLLIASLTTFPARINDVWIVIKSLMHQSVQPDKIILWLSQEQFPDKKIPQKLEELIPMGLEVRFCNGDLKAHKKYVYALKKFPDDYIVTFDDDLYYESNAIANLLKLKRKYPDSICTNRAHQISFSSDFSLILPYSKWYHNYRKNDDSLRLLATGGCGTLYEARLLDDKFKDKNLIKNLSLNADDMWLKVMATLQGTKVATNDKYGKDPIAIGKTQTQKLVSENVKEGGNDSYLNNLMKHFNLGSKNFLDKNIKID